MKEKIALYLAQSNKLREGYLNSLSPVNINANALLKEVMLDLPEWFSAMYSLVSGTPYTIENQVFMDFMPGFLLIHIEEYKQHFLDLDRMIKAMNIQGVFFPILRNYASDFVALEKSSGQIYRVFHYDNEFHLIHENADKFLDTLNANYQNHVYYLDDDGYLDYDEDLEYTVAESINPNINFWLISD